MECNYDTVEGNQDKAMLSETTRTAVESIRNVLMKQGEEERDINAIK